MVGMALAEFCPLQFFPGCSVFSLRFDPLRNGSLLGGPCMGQALAYMFHFCFCFFEVCSRPPYFALRAFRVLTGRSIMRCGLDRLETSATR